MLKMKALALGSLLFCAARGAGVAQGQVPATATHAPAPVISSTAQRVLRSVAQDGGWWKSLTYSQQLVVVESTMSAFQTAYVDGIDATALLVRSDSFHDYMALTSRADHGIPQFSHTLGYYISAVTDFYTIHPEATKASVALVISCLADNPIRSCVNVARESSASQ